MEAILVVNAGSSSLKFQLFALEAGDLARRVRGQLDGIGVRPRLFAADAAGAVLVDRGYDAAAVADLPAAIAETRAWLGTLEGFALALRTINEQASTADMKTMSLQYLETLKSVGASPASKIVVPMELSGLVAGVVALADATKEDGNAPTSG